MGRRSDGAPRSPHDVAHGATHDVTHGVTGQTGGTPARAATARLLRVAGLAIALLTGLSMSADAQDARKGYDIRPTGLRPVYPDGFTCSPLTSLYASWTDVDGSRRGERHSGVDGGRVGEAIRAPADGVIRAAWKANWGWGDEGALLISHSSGDMNLGSGSPHYYSEFDHLDYEQVKKFRVGQRIVRGQVLATVGRPGGNSRYLPEVHWEVWEVGNDNALNWRKNRFGREVWTNRTARLVDPLYGLSLGGDAGGRSVIITPFETNRNYSGFVGFTYILPCARR